MFKAFTDKNIREHFIIKIRSKTDVERLLYYLKLNKVRCNWLTGLEFDKYTILKAINGNNFKSINLHFYYKKFDDIIFAVTYSDFVVTYSDSESDTHSTIYNYTLDDIMEENEMNKEFTKSDLKSGMIVEIRDGIKYEVLLNACVPEMGVDLIINEDLFSWDKLSNYDEFLKGRYRELDIVKVYKPKRHYAIFTFEEDELELIWERKDYKEMTVAEIEKELGYKVKIVKEKE